VKTDLVLDPRGADVGEMLAAARAADTGSWNTVWTYDHFSGLISAAAWSRDPFVVLGAIAAVTEHVHVGVLVANVVNRHPAQLACAVNSLQSLAPGRVRCGVGAGSARGGKFASEHHAIRRSLAPPAVRRAVLAESIAALRALWDGAEFDGEHIHVDASMAVIDGAPLPPIIVGGSGIATIDVACTHADGVNLLPSDDLAGRVAMARARRPDGFDIGVFDRLDTSHPLGGDPEPLAELGVDRRTLWVTAPYPVDAIGRIAEALG
jgi:alkanesulfonate monooxygenase SsuD/methylene tetrahydromethanopterin reductase-like flavin-dependent oxidoreductase (luciferase family)